MAKFAATENGYRIYELDEKECKQHWREYPCFVCWFETHDDEIGNMTFTENESETLEEMVDWCKHN